MIIIRTPFRISFFGGGTDLPIFSEKYGGAVIGTSINKYIYHTVSEFPSNMFEYSIRFSYSKVESTNDINLIKHAPFREILKFFKLHKDIEVNIAADLPSFSGLGTSSAFTVGLIKGLIEFKKSFISSHDLAKTAIIIEQEILKESVGSQDQVFASYGGFNLIRFNKDKTFDVSPININQSRLSEIENSLLIFYTGIKRKSQNLEKRKINNFNNIDCNLKKMLKMVDEGYDILNGNQSLSKFGELLGKSWKEKKMLDSKVSNNLIDEVYKVAIESGALGGKLLGAGGGGFLLLFIPPERQKKVRENLSGFHEVKFKFDVTGSQVLHK